MLHMYGKGRRPRPLYITVNGKESSPSIVGIHETSQNGNSLFFVQKASAAPSAAPLNRKGTEAPTISIRKGAKETDQSRAASVLLIPTHVPQHRSKPALCVLVTAALYSGFLRGDPGGRADCARGWFRGR